MPVGGRDSYFIRGAHPEEYAPRLEEALANLQAFWLARPSLAPHLPGNLVVTISIEGAEVTTEITASGVLDDFIFGRGPMAILEYLARAMPLPMDEALDLLSEAAGTVRVDTIQIPDDPNAWESGVGLGGYGAPAPEQVLPGATNALIGELIREADARAGRAPGRPRPRESQVLIKQAVKAGRDRGLSDTEIARQLGLPRTTVRDTRYRLERQERLAETFDDRRPGTPLTADQREVVLQAVVDHDGNASAAARSLGLPARTVREIRQRARQEAGTEGMTVATDAPQTRTTYTEQDKQELLDSMINLIRTEQISASEAGRRMGVNPRTARGWVRQRKIGS